MKGRQDPLLSQRVARLKRNGVVWFAVVCGTGSGLPLLEIILGAGAEVILCVPRLRFKMGSFKVTYYDLRWPGWP